MIYYLKHIDIEGPGTLGDFFASRGFESRTIELFNGDALPADFINMKAVVILGGPMNVDEEDRYPFLKAEHVFIQELIARKIPTVGLCLGAQLIAKAAGAKVYKSPVKEIGFFPLSVTNEGKQDPLLKGTGEVLDLFEWHEDTFDLPKGAQLLLEGAGCRHQAFRLGEKVYGFQCHMEITQEDALAWVDGYVPAGSKEHQILTRQIRHDFFTKKEKLCQISQKTYNNLLKLII
ncbi:MAG: type 1 glutamine amidotransferase [Candidatus Omnitrophota bacterium]